MIGFLRGEIDSIYEDRVVLDVNGVGYNVFMPYSHIEMLPGRGSQVKVYTFLNVREDAMHLYGFSTKDDLDFFKLLIQVNGIGPKGALQLMSFMGSDNIKFAIMSSDAKSISKAPGIGAKTAQRIILDLKDKVDLIDTFEHKLMDNSESTAGMSDAMAEAVEALAALGYAKKDALKAVKDTGLAEDAQVEDILKMALRNIARI